MNSKSNSPSPELQSLVSQLVAQAEREDRTVLLETEGLKIAQACGLGIPEQKEIHDEKDILDLDFPLFVSEGVSSEKLVLKAVSDEILHKTEWNAVRIISNTQEAVHEAFIQMRTHLFAKLPAKEHPDLHFTLNEFIPHPSLTGELLLSLKWTADFGAVLTLSAGGVHAEFLARQFIAGQEMSALNNITVQLPQAMNAALQNLPWVKLMTQTQRGQPPLLSFESLSTALAVFFERLSPFLESHFSEFEINPLVISPGKHGSRLVALDALVKLKHALPESLPLKLPPPRPLQKIHHLLEPTSIAIIGVSEKMNPGRVVLQNTLQAGFPASQLFVIKPGALPQTKIDGCLCVPSVSELPQNVDLLVVAVEAKQVPSLIEEVCRTQKVASLIVIPGGLEEKAGTTEITQTMQQALLSTRATSWQGPVINGGNCLGIVSAPGKYNTMFIPAYKAPRVPSIAPQPLVLLSQSGAFGISRLDQLGSLHPKYSLSIGNQMDLTIGDYLHYFKKDPSLRVFAVYLEGFRPQDGNHFLSAAQELIQAGKHVILYRSGRTIEGAHASASHTASIAGDYAVTRSLCSSIGIHIADSIEEFEDLALLLTSFTEPPKGNRLAAASNAGFECVAIGDRLGALKLAELYSETTRALDGVLQSARLSQIVDVHHPFDLTPMANDAITEKVFEILLSAKETDLGILGIVPLTPALNSLAQGDSHKENLLATDGIATRLITLSKRCKKPFVVSVDGGARYEPLRQFLRENGIPAFPHIDRALRALNRLYRVI